MPDVATGTDFLDTLNNVHSSVKFMIEIESNELSFLDIQLLNRSPQVETKDYVKPRNTGVL